ncbi:MAG: indolepyruvate ferredoxin oxidoreductase subunit alpha [Desulfobacteraceae bacterium]|nr:indolepyruvate ferredoxin oxidoreductase subunit alpha [Desulfobacteraceae bacterium]
MGERKILLGNEAVALGLAESGCTMATSYPGTPASEVLGAMDRIRKDNGLEMHLEWSINEKVAYEVALANSYTGRRSAVIMKQVGLNVAADPLMSSAYTGVKGGFILISADDPGPHSSQTEQDSRLYAMLAKIPVLDPISPADARRLIPLAYGLSERFEVPVMLRPTTRVCHARQDIEINPVTQERKLPLFEKNPARWAATPKFRLTLHGQLNEKNRRISEDESFMPVLLNPDSIRNGSRSCIVGSGAAVGYLQEVMNDLGQWDAVPAYRVVMPYPLSNSFVDELLARYDRILVVEETMPVIEMQFGDRVKVSGRRSGAVPSAGELLPEVVEGVVRSFLGLPKAVPVEVPAFPGRRPTLCAGCPHRAAFFALKRVFPKGVYPGDIGCYTLGLNLGAVDTVLCMGASINQAAGFYHSFAGARADKPPICATIGDSTFFHSGIPALANAVVQGARFVLVIMDNSTAAMTGHQPTPALGVNLDGVAVPKLSIAEIVRACGVRFVEEADPYEMRPFMELLRAAGKHAKEEDGGIAVVISRRPCLMDRSQPAPASRRAVRVSEKCKGCDFCYKQFECPAIRPQGEKEPILIDSVTCTGCGVCVAVCPHGALELEE